MKKTTIECSCDYCKESISEDYYNNCVEVSLRIDVPDPRGRAGECNGTTFVLCDNCAVRIGVVKEEIHNGYLGTRSRILKVLEENKNKILQMFFKG